MIEFLFIDLDDTILDFHKAERVALEKTLRSLGLEPTDTVMTRYSQINKEHWERLERKEITREFLLVSRFAQLMEEFGIDVSAELCARTYENNLSIGHYFMPGAREAVEALSKKYKLYITSNGTSKIQAGRLESAAISHFFQDIFISQDIGINKPDKGYFDRCFARIPGFDPKKAMIVGDSLTSDILGGKQAGIATCWVNPKGAQPRADIVPDYEIPSLAQLEALLETINGVGKNQDSEPHYLPLLMSIGISVGMALGAAMQNIPIGMCLGLSIGVCLGAGLDAKKRNKSKEKEDI